MIQTPFYRIYQKVLKFAAYFLGIKEPKTISGIDSIKKIPELLKKYNLKQPLVVTDNGLHSLGLVNPLLDEISKSGLNYGYFYDVNANPTILNVENGLSIYKMVGCDSIIAVGGGSALDCAKMIGARASNPNKSVEKMKGLLHVRKALPFLVAVPTTAGTGSETTLAAVIVNEKTHHKYAINDPHLIPKFAVFDPKLLMNLPGKITSTTGMDALTHSVEAFIGHSNTRKTKKAAVESIKLIQQYLVKSYADGHNLEFREKMQHASFLAGVAFTRAYVGYVHALAHALGGKYNVPHGLANAIILPYVLESFGKKAHKKLAILCDELSLCEKTENNETKAAYFIKWIRSLNKSMLIPEKFDIEYNETDVNEMVEHAFKEGNPLYPVPREFSRIDFKNIYKKVLK